MQHYDIIIIGGGAAGLMAAYGAKTSGKDVSVLVLEKMPRPGRKIMITGKGRCNFTNVKDWSDFSQHIRANSNALRPSFYNLTPENLIDFFNDFGVESVVERGDRAFPVSHRSMDIVDALVDAALHSGARIETGAEVSGVRVEETDGAKSFIVDTADGTENTLADTENNNNENGNADAENAVIKCNDGSQVVICGTGTLNIQANGKNGIKSGSSTEEEGEASLTIQELTLNIDAQVNDAVNAEAALNVESGNITITAGDDAMHCDYTLNIGADGTDGPVITINNCQEGLEGAGVNVYSGDIDIKSTDDCINAANADLTGYDYTLNIYGGTINASSTSGDGFDSNGDLTISGGNVTVWTESVADNEPLDADGTVTVLGGTVLAAGGSSGMGMNLTADQSCVIFGGEGGAMMEPGEDGQQRVDSGAAMAPGGRSKPGDNSGTTVSPEDEDQSSGMKEDSQNISVQPPKMKDNSQNSDTQNAETGSGSQADSGQGMGTENDVKTGSGRMQEPGQGIAPGVQNSLISENSTFTITSSDGSVIYTADALCGAFYVFYSSADLTAGEAYTLSSGELNTEATAQTGTVISGRGGGQNNIG